MGDHIHDTFRVVHVNFGFHTVQIMHQVGVGLCLIPCETFGHQRVTSDDFFTDRNSAVEITGGHTQFHK